MLSRLLQALATIPNSFPKSKYVIYLQCFFLVFTNLYCLFHGLVFGIEGSLLLVIVIFIWNRPRFVLSTLPFAVVMLGYSFLRNYIRTLDPSAINITNIITWEKTLFGHPIPTVVLQNLVNQTSYRSTIIFLATFIYAAFYWLPAVISILLWEKNHRFFWQFMIGLIILSYLGFAGYYFFPAAPPWWAAYFGYLDLPDPKILNPEFMLKLPINHVAAMPSLHAAYPTYFSLMIMKFFGRKTAPIILIPILISLSAVYLSHHYVIDIVAGVALAISVTTILHFLAGLLSHQLSTTSTQQ